MHLQLFLLALVAPLALSLPQPIGQGESGNLVARQGPGNSTGGGEGGYHKEKHHGPPGGPHPARALIERQGSGNSTVHGGKGKPHDFTGKEHYGGPPHPERDLSQRQESGNSTGGGEHHGDGKYHHEGGHPGPKVDKRIEEGNGTTGGITGKEKFKPDGYHGGPQRPSEHKRSIVDMILDRRQHNSTSSGEEGNGKHEGKKGHFEHNGPE